mmetsp:Transcript_42591/g.99318  ORF Transcript_42591/g.99318 Transcript_42591/m.99318 type:complete len:230 (+) Transcript_42591:670-1359(+)
MKETRHEKGQGGAKLTFASRAVTKWLKEATLHQSMDQQIPTSTPKLAQGRGQEQWSFHSHHGLHSKGCQEKSVSQNAQGQHAIGNEGEQIQSHIRSGKAERGKAGEKVRSGQERRKARGSSDAVQDEEKQAVQDQIQEKAEAFGSSPRQALHLAVFEADLTVEAEVEGESARRGCCTFGAPPDNELHPPEGREDCMAGQNEAGGPGAKWLERSAQHERNGCRGHTNCQC